MRRSFLILFTLVLTILAGTVSFFTQNSAPTSRPTENVMISVKPTPRLPLLTFEPELTGITEPETPKSNLAHNDLRQCSKNTGLKWVALLKVSGVYRTEAPNINYCPWEEDAWGGYYPIKYKQDDSTLFIFENNGLIKPGPTETVLDNLMLNQGHSASRSDTAEADSDKFYLIRDDDSSYIKNIDLENRHYKLRSARVTDINEQPSLALVLEWEGTIQPLRLYELDQRLLGNIVWLGDLDNDKKLDMLIQYFPVNGDGVTEILYLSSPASKGQLVSPYAIYKPVDSRQCPQSQH